MYLMCSFKNLGKTLEGSWTFSVLDILPVDLCRGGQTAPRILEHFAVLYWFAKGLAFTGLEKKPF